MDWREGNAAAGDQFMELVYNELRRLASHCLGGERPGHTLQPTALVHELYLHLFASAGPVTWQNRAHFFGVAAQKLRHILVDHARARRAEKRGGGRMKLTLTAAQGWFEDRNEDLLALDECLAR